MSSTNKYSVKIKLGDLGPVVPTSDNNPACALVKVIVELQMEHAKVASGGKKMAEGWRDCCRWALY